MGKQERFKLFSLQLDEIKKKLISQNYIVYTYREAFNKQKIDYEIINKNEDHIIPILLDNHGKIIAISTMNKGQIRVFLLI